MDDAVSQPTKPVFQAVDQPRLYVAVASRIAEHIRDTPLAPGAALPAERDLAKQFKVSRTTVREAMIALETAGLVEVRVGDGTYVGSRLAPGTLLPWEADGDFGPGPHEQFRVRSVIECAAAADAALNITDAELAELKRLLDVMSRDLEGDASENGRAEFHELIAKASRNSILLRLIREFWVMRSGDMWRTVRERVVRPEHHVQALHDRIDIYEALCKRDRIGAEAAMRCLMGRIRKRYFE